MSVRARDGRIRADSHLEVIVDENYDGLRGRGTKRFTTGAGPQPPKVRKAGLFGSFFAPLLGWFSTSEEDVLDNRIELNSPTSNMSKSRDSSSSDVVCLGETSPEVVCLEPEESQEEEVEVIKEIHRSSPEALRERRKSVEEVIKAVKAADIVIVDDESSSGSVSLISDNLNGVKGPSPGPDDSISRQNTPNRFRPEDFQTPKNDSWSRRRRPKLKTPRSVKDIPMVGATTPVSNGRWVNRMANMIKTPDSVYHTPIDYESILSGAGGRLVYDKLLKERISESVKRRPAGVEGRIMKDVRRPQPAKPMDYLLRVKSVMRKVRSRQASDVVTLDDDNKSESSVEVVEEGSSRQSEAPSSSSYHSSCRERIDDLVASLASFELKSTESLDQLNKYKYERKHQTYKQKELIETTKQIREIRHLHEADLIENVSQRLWLNGIRKPLPKKKEKEEFPELGPEALNLCNRAWSRGHSEEIFCEGFDTKIKRKDLATLAIGRWLNDEVITFFLNLIVDRSKDDASLPKVHTFNTFFYVNISTKGYASVKRWTRKVDIFAHEILLIPVHVGTVHWCMAIVDFGQKTIEYFDSMHQGDNGALSFIKSYLQEESKDKKKVDFNFAGWSYNVRNDCPMQKNGYDCGVFSVHVAEYCSRRAPLTFSQQHMDYFRKRMVFEIVSKKLM